MRKADLTADQIFEAEKAAEDRRQNRAGGFKLMKERDSSQAVFPNGVVMKWHVARPIAPEGTRFYQYPPGCNIPEDSFVLEIDGKDYLFDAEEFRKALRWA